jgi:hypothetical protein
MHDSVIPTSNWGEIKGTKHLQLEGEHPTAQEL